MPETKPLILYDRSRTTTDWQCPCKRYWGYEFDGKGLTTDTIHLELYLGSAIHDGLAALAHGVGIDDIAVAAFTQVNEVLLKNTVGEVDADVFAAEQGTLVEGLLRGFAKHVWPKFQAQYPEIVAIEKELLFNHDGLTFMSKPDLLLRDKEGLLHYLEYKSTGWANEAWMNQWSTAVQLHSSVRAVEATLGEKITSVIVQGLYKGRQSYGKQSSAFCYAYYKAGQPPFREAEWAYEYKAGLKRVPTWTMDGGVKKWVDEMPEEVLAAQFPQAPPIFLNEGLIDAFFRQRTVREHEIHDCVTSNPNGADLDQFFPQRFDQCNPAFGKPCMFKKLCFGRIDHPLEHGFSYRVPHHKPELDAWEARDAKV